MAGKRRRQSLLKIDLFPYQRGRNLLSMMSEASLPIFRFPSPTFLCSLRKNFPCRSSHSRFNTKENVFLWLLPWKFIYRVVGSCRISQNYVEHSRENEVKRTSKQQLITHVG